ncbi:MAG: hypothetical protein OXT67_09900 [Zetaproteobacteria bacterium]|nr:hypothetical protein [Zetaproteobacteria bacterium]
MTAQNYIQNALSELREPVELPKQLKDLPLKEAIKKRILSHKFRKYSAKPELVEHIEIAVTDAMEKEEPINLTFLNGAYKLWRLEEAPHPDWAELFSLIYFTNWVKPICGLYKPGVWFDFFMDDWIVTELNNIDQKNVDLYLEGFNKLITFIKQFQPSNLRMTLTPVKSQFESRESFDGLIEKEVQKLTKEKGGLVELEKAEESAIDLNAQPTKEQLVDPDWKRKSAHLHTAYMRVKAGPGYHHRKDKILVFTQPLPSGMLLSVGTTKTSIVKFWVGVGALQKRGESYIETILSFKQLNNANLDTERFNIDGLDHKNFKTIRYLS